MTSQYRPMHVLRVGMPLKQEIKGNERTNIKGMDGSEGYLAKI